MLNTLQKLTETLQKWDTRRAALPEVAKEVAHFFEQTLAQAEKLSQEKKEEFATQFIAAAHKLAALLNPYIEVIPLSEESLLSSLETPHYFDENEWKAVQDAKNHIGEIAEHLLPYLTKVPKLEADSHESLRDDKKKHPHHPPRSEWMKS